ncbi:gliding motility protein GldM [Labilibacter sediminis]|nr:gliding motility protein GldM [Labilibacter sediminis]
MSGGNCPETPRQKMIGMMYLFLTAMLALNVSGELLQAFITMDKGFIQSRETVERKNEVLYDQFRTAHSNNPGKAGDEWREANKIKTAADSLVNHIEDLKIILAHKSSGPEATPNDYVGDNQDIAPQVMITEKAGARSKELKKLISEYKELLLSYLNQEDPADTAFISGFTNIFDTSDEKGEKDVVKSWESTKFEHVPLSASMAMLSKIQGDVRNAEADIVASLYSDIDKESYKFTDMMSVVKPYKTTILEGETYKAELYMAAYDPNIIPKIHVNGKPVRNIEQGKGILEMPKMSVGEHSWKGIIEMPSPDGSEDVPYEIEGIFQVVKPSAVISPIKMNVFYEGVENPVAISAPGVASKDLKVTMTNVNKKPSKGIFIVTPRAGTAGKESVVKVTAEIGGRQKVMGVQNFRIKRVPDPVPEVAGKSGGKIAKNLLMAQSAVFAEMKDFDFELEYTVTRFNVSVLKNGYIVDEPSKSNRFTKEQKELIKNMPRGSKVSIEDIRAKGPSGTRNLGTMTFVLD